MPKITLSPIASTTDISLINSNMQKIATELNDKVLYRKNPVGQPNTVQNDIDLNGKRIINLPQPVLGHEAARLSDVGFALAASEAAEQSANIAANAAFTAEVSKTQAALSAASAADSAAKAKSNKVINVLDFPGVDPTGVTDSYVGFVAAIAAAAGRTLLAEGTFLLSAPPSLANNSNYDFNKANFIGGSGCSSKAVFWTVGKIGIRVFGGNSQMTAATPNETIGTGTYTNFTFYYFENCVKSSVTFSYAVRMFTVVNFYNCVDCFGDYNTTEDCNASFAAVADSVATGTACRNVTFFKNTVLRGGDDGIALLARGRDVVNCSASFNTVTKTTRSNGELDGSVPAATGLRAGRFGTSGDIIGGGFYFNNGADMVTDFIRAHNCIDFSVVENKCAGFAKRSVESCFQIGVRDGTTSYPFVRGVVSGNVGSGAVLTNKRVFYFQAATETYVDKNVAQCAIPGDGAMRFEYCSALQVYKNTPKNTLGYCINIQSTCTDMVVGENNCSVFTAVGIANFGTNSRIYDNKGVITKSKGVNLVPAGISTRVVDHNLSPIDSTLPTIKITPKSSIGNGVEWWVSNVTTQQFTVNTKANPTTNNFDFEWLAEKQ